MESVAEIKRRKKKINHIVNKLQGGLKSSAAAGKVAPEGCLSVYVGAEQQRFVIKTEFVNHPLFRMLLEDAESEYGFDSHGPLLLPCRADVFGEILLEIYSARKGIDYGYACGSCTPFNRVM